MSKTIETKTSTMNKIQRTYQFIGSVPRNGSPTLEIFRETIWLDSSTGEVIGLPQISTVAIDWDNLKDRTWELSDGSSVTALQIYEALALAFDEIASE